MTSAKKKSPKRVSKSPDARDGVCYHSVADIVKEFHMEPILIDVSLMPRSSNGKGLARKLLGDAFSAPKA